MKYLLAIMFLMSIQATASTAMSRINLDWYESNYIEVDEILEAEDSVLTIPTINTIGNIYKYRDGFVRSMITPSIIKAFFYHPRLMTAWFAKRQNHEDFDAFINELQQAPFTNFMMKDEAWMEVVGYRLKLIELLPSYIANEDNADLKDVAVQLLEKLTSIEPCSDLESC